MSNFKRTFRNLACVFALAASIATISYEARAEMPQTDVALVQQMGDASNDRKIQALDLYYALHVSELIVQNMNERRTGSMFAVQRAKRANKAQKIINELQKKANKVVAERSAKIRENQDLRIKLGEISGLDFSDPLVMAPDAPLEKPKVTATVPADLIAARETAWSALGVAQNAWKEERLILLDAQQRYDETRDVPIGDHLRAMTLAETNYARAIGAYRLIEAKIAVASGKSLANVLGAL